MQLQATEHLPSAPRGDLVCLCSVVRQAHGMVATDQVDAPWLARYNQDIPQLDHCG